MSPDLLAAAVKYAGRLGVGVVPIVGKRPAAEHGYASASTDPAVIRRMFAAVKATGIGVAAGDRLVIVDIDRIDAIAELGGVLPTTLTARSGGGGFHLYYRRPPDLRLSYRRDRLPMGVEVKLGNGGTVAPPSLHPSGRRYQWVRRLEPVTAPGWLLDALKCEARTTVVPPRRSYLGETRYGRAALERKAHDVAAAAEGTRQNTLNGACFALAQLVPSGHLRPEVIADVLAEAALAAGLPAREVRWTIGRALAAGQANPYWPERRA